MSLGALDTAALAAVAEAYDIGVITRQWPASRGIENRNFFLTAMRDGLECEYVLTIMQRPASAGEALVSLLDTCFARGLPVPAAVRTRAGATEVVLDGKPAMLNPRLPGRHVLNPTPAQVASLGRFIARLHIDTREIAPQLPEYPRGFGWLGDQSAACLPELSYLRQALLRDALREVGELLRRDDVAGLPTGAIHGDLFRDNVLFNRWGLSGVLDFHHAARGILIYDLAVAANDWCVDAGGMVDGARLQHLVAAYDRIRPLEPVERWHLPMFMQYAGLAFWLSRLAVALDQRRGRTDRANDPAVFERIVARRRSTPVRIDPWILDQNVAARER